ncbi:WAT1-related protein At2g39510-like isoform X1 [Lolium perenne]|uniref:WAT1-related protein At2g39510-like isoform X1 n=1 Tax=Lolium perenne TaxID=4522 RepID=UPI0021F63C82|nr:WAT1-related protein At2g39510-like isoform X1 [Lolium perenne]
MGLMPTVAMLLVQIGFAGNNLLSKMALDNGASPYVLISCRSLIAALFLAPFAVYFERLVDSRSTPFFFRLLLSESLQRSIHLKFLPLLDILETRVRAVRRLRELLTTKFPPGTFPVKVTFSLLLCSSGNASSCTLLTLCIMYA